MTMTSSGRAEEVGLQERTAVLGRSRNQEQGQEFWSLVQRHRWEGAKLKGNSKKDHREEVVTFEA